MVGVKENALTENSRSFLYWNKMPIYHILSISYSDYPFFWNGYRNSEQKISGLHNFKKGIFFLLILHVTQYKMILNNRFHVRVR